MRVKVALLDGDVGYLQRIAEVFRTKYSEKLELYTFSELDTALSEVGKGKKDILLVSDAFDINIRQIPEGCGFAYFVESPGIESHKGYPAICKFQKAETLYKQIVNLYADKASDLMIGQNGEGRNTSMICFSSPAGGVGTSSAAAAYALRLAQQGKHVLFLSFEKFGSADTFFHGEGPFGLSDIIYSLKSGKSNLQLKLESDVKKDERGVCFYSAPKIALDIQELDRDDIEKLLDTLLKSGAYDWIVVDLDFDMSGISLAIYRRMHTLVWLSDGSETANTKTERAFTALSVSEGNAAMPLTRRVNLLYNKFSNKTGKVIEMDDLHNIGGIPRFEHVTLQQVIEKIAKLDMLDEIAKEVMMG